MAKFQISSHKEHTNIEDEIVWKYYKQDQSIHQLQSIHVERVGDSTNFVILFPTGTIYMVGGDPFSILGKVQLDLKQDEIIQDSVYCVSDNEKDHCFWLIDSKQQVWKCFNEMEVNSNNWSLINITILSGLHTFQKFMVPAMTYSDYYLISYLNSISCVN